MNTASNISNTNSQIIVPPTSIPKTAKQTMQIPKENIMFQPPNPLNKPPNNANGGVPSNSTNPKTRTNASPSKKKKKK